MVSSVQRCFKQTPFLPAFPTMASLRDRAGEAFRRGLSIGIDMLKDNAVGLIALGCDVAVGNALGSRQSLFSAYMIGQMLHQLSSVFNRYAVQGILFEKMAKAIRDNDLLTVRQCIYFTDVNFQDNDGNSLLHLALSQSNPKPAIIEELASHGADPFCKNREGVMPIFKVKNNVGLLKRVLGCHAIKAFDHCQNIHDFYEVFFPAHRNKLPPNWEQIVLEKGSPSKEAEQWVKEADDLIDWQKSMHSLSKIAAILDCRNPSLEEGLKIIFKNCPIAKRLWELAGAPKIQLGRGHGAHGFQVNENGSAAVYQAHTHTIEISQNSSWKMIVDSLLFELLNSLNKDVLLKIGDLADEGEIEQEEYALLLEWLERGTIMWHLRICAAMKESVADYRGHFPPLWIELNKPINGFLPHADGYRWDWDNNDYALYFFAKHPHFLRRRLKELS